MSEIPFVASLAATEVELGGRIEVDVEIPARASTAERAKALVLKLTAEIHGSGDREFVNEQLERVPGPFGAETFRQRFSFNLPTSGPVSYEGRYVKITWSVGVSLDIPWAIDPKCLLVFTVRPRGYAAYQQKTSGGDAGLSRSA